MFSNTPATTIAEPQTAKAILAQAMADSDNYVVEIEYTDSKNKTNRRVVSPIRFVTPDRFIALCLCREAPRVFYLKNCSNISLQPAWKYVMPVEMVEC